MAQGDGGPFYEQTMALFRSINDLDLDELRDLVDDDHGIVDVDPGGGTLVIPSREAWEEYMGRNFSAMRSAGANLWTEILEYHGHEADRLGYSVVRFVQGVEVGGVRRRNRCVATIVWKLTDAGWKEARWHCSLEGTEG